MISTIVESYFSSTPKTATVNVNAFVTDLSEGNSFEIINENGEQSFIDIKQNNDYNVQNKLSDIDIQIVDDKMWILAEDKKDIKIVVKKQNSISFNIFEIRNGKYTKEYSTKGKINKTIEYKQNHVILNQTENISPKV